MSNTILDNSKNQRIEKLTDLILENYCEHPIPLKHKKKN